MVPVCKDHKWGYMDRSGAIVISFQYDIAYPFSEGLAAVAKVNERQYCFIDKTGKVVIDGVQGIGAFSEGICRITGRDDGQVYFMDKDGNPVTGDRWYRATDVRNGMAAVSNGIDVAHPGKWAVVRLHGGNIPSSWAKKEIMEAISLDLVPEDMRERYTRDISRADFCRLAITYLEKHTGKSVSDIIKQWPGWSDYRPDAFTDTNDYFVKWAAALHLVEGRGNGTFDPDAPITRQEAAKILFNTFAIYASGYKHFSPFGSFEDAELIADWARDPVWYMNEQGIMLGIGENRFDPLGYCTREQAFVTFLRLGKSGPTYGYPGIK